MNRANATDNGQLTTDKIVMTQSLFPYYERELTFIRQFAQEFAERYPAAAGRLLLEPNRSGDPHVETADRVVCAVGRANPSQARRRISRADRSAVERALSALSCSGAVDGGRSVRSRCHSRAACPTASRFRSGSRLQTARVGNLPCRFRTGYPVTLWPIELTSAALQSPPFPREYEPPRRTAAALALAIRMSIGLDILAALAGRPAALSVRRSACRRHAV